MMLLLLSVVVPGIMRRHRQRALLELLSIHLSRPLLCVFDALIFELRNEQLGCRILLVALCQKTFVQQPIISIFIVISFSAIEILVLSLDAESFWSLFVKKHSFSNQSSQYL
jgi:hypothetical protein